VPPFRLYVKPVLPLAEAAILPFAEVRVVGLVTVPFTIMVIPAQGFGAVRVKVADPVQPFEFFAVMEYEPAANPVKLAETWNAAPFRLKVKPEPPEALTVILPSDPVGVLGFVTEPLTTTVMPAQGLVGGVTEPPPPLEQA
jgi:hypothetical protein